MRWTIYLLAAAWGLWGACLAVAAPPQAGDTKGVGEKAPPIELQEVLKAPAGTKATLQDLRGKVIVLEFWATWCGTCVRSIPHLNELADELKDEVKDGRVQFIAVTDEAREDVLPFLEKHPVRGWVGLNTSGSMFKAFGIDGRPLTVVIRPDGVVDARICPWETPFPIRAQNLRNLLEGKPSGLVSSRLLIAGEVLDPQGKPLAGAWVRVTQRTGGDDWRRVGDDLLTAKDGRFRLDLELPAGFINEYPVRVEFKHPDFLYSWVEDLRLYSPEQQAGLRVTLPDGNTLRGRVVDPAGHAVPGAKVMPVYPDEGDRRKCVLTDADGKFELRGLPAGAVEVRVLKLDARAGLPCARFTFDPRVAAPGKGGTVIQAAPSLPPGRPTRSLLGMTVVDVDKEMAAKLGLEQPCILILDPGPHPDQLQERLGLSASESGDCIWGGDAAHPAADVESFSRLLAGCAEARAREPQGQGPQGKRPEGVELHRASWNDLMQTGGPHHQPKLTEDEVAELRRQTRDVQGH